MLCTQHIQTLHTKNKGKMEKWKSGNKRKGNLRKQQIDFLRVDQERYANGGKESKVSRASGFFEGLEPGGGSACNGINSNGN